MQTLQLHVLNVNSKNELVNSKRSRDRQQRRGREGSVLGGPGGAADLFYIISCWFWLITRSAGQTGLAQLSGPFCVRTQSSEQQGCWQAEVKGCARWPAGLPACHLWGTGWQLTMDGSLPPCVMLHLLTWFQLQYRWTVTSFLMRSSRTIDHSETKGLDTWEGSNVH